MSFARTPRPVFCCVEWAPEVVPSPPLLLRTIVPTDIPYGGRGQGEAEPSVCAESLVQDKQRPSSRYLMLAVVESPGPFRRFFLDWTLG